MSKHIYGIYCKGEICYVGKTNNMRQRWREYKSEHQNPNREAYDMKISQYMREQGFDNFSHEMIETVPEEYASQAEGMWYHTFKDLGFDMKNDQEPGNGTNVKGTICYQNNQARKREKIKCPDCGSVVVQGYIAEHRRLYCSNYAKTSTEI